MEVIQQLSRKERRQGPSTHHILDRKEAGATLPW